MAYPSGFLDDLRTRVSLAEIVGRRVTLQKRGREFTGLCPFHKEKTPSFHVVEEKGFYHCFGCGAHGDVIGFAMRTSNLSFREAVEDLARMAGLHVPADDPRETARAARAATLYEVCEAACVFFSTQLNGPRGGVALTYLANRGVTAALIAEFRLGYAPASGNPITNQLAGKFPEALLLEAGLIRKDEGGRVYDFFRDRVMFPIMNRRGQVIAFGGRIMGEGNPKYLNSPDSPIFQKGRNLFALNLARKSIGVESPPIVAEGYMDVIALHGAGFRTAVAPLGTALTEEQIGELWRLEPEPILCFDGDAPGQKAALRALDRTLPLIQPGYSLRFMALPDAEDPDSLIQKQGAPAFKRCLDASRQLSEFLWDSVTRDRDFSTPERLSRLEVILKEKISKIENGQSQRQFNRYYSDKLWNLYLQTRKSKVGRKDVGERPNITSTDWAFDQITLLILALAIRNPELIRNDIDQFAAVVPRAKGHMDLQHKVIDLIAKNPEITSEDLEEAIEHSGLGGELHRIFRSKIFASGIAQSKTIYFSRAPTESVESTWRALFQRHLLPETKKNLDEAVAAFGREPSQERWGTIVLYRQLLADLLLEVELIRERWNSVERTGKWPEATPQNGEMADVAR